MALPGQKRFTDALQRFQSYRVTVVWLMVFLSGASAAAALPKQKHAGDFNPRSAAKCRFLSHICSNFPSRRQPCRADILLVRFILM